jgi:hypothetical protein
MIHTLQCFASYHTTNIGSSNLCTSWYCQDELSMLNHELLKELFEVLQVRDAYLFS